MSFSICSIDREVDLQEAGQLGTLSYAINDGPLKVYFNNVPNKIWFAASLWNAGDKVTSQGGVSVDEVWQGGQPAKRTSKQLLKVAEIARTVFDTNAEQLKIKTCKTKYPEQGSTQRPAI